MKKNQMLIFLTFFLLFSFFAQWNDAWDCEPLLAQTKSIVDREKFNIDPYRNTTPLKIKGEHFYPFSRGMGKPFLGTTSYMLSKPLSELIPAPLLPKSERIYYQGQRGDKVSQLFFDKGPRWSLTRLLSVIFLSALLGALSVLLIYKISGQFLQNERDRLIITLAYGLGTSIFPYATTPYRYVSALFFITLSLYLILKENKRSIYYFTSGLSSGLALIIHVTSIFPVIFLVLFLFTNKRSQLKFFIAGTLIGHLPGFTYGLFGTENLFSASAAESASLTTAWWKKSYSGLLLVLPNKIIRRLFYPSNGLFFYYPWLIFSLLGLYHLYKENKKYVVLSFLTMLSVSLPLISYFGASFHFGFGPRRLLIMLPIFLLPILYVFKKINKKLLLTLIVISILINLTGLQAWEGDSSDIKNRPQAFRELRPWKNPLKDHYFPLFVKEGPRSILLENLLLNQKISIWNVPGTERNHKSLTRTEIPLITLNRIFKLRIPFLPVLAIFLLLGILIMGTFPLFSNLSHKYLLLIIVLLLLLFGFFIRTASHAAGKGWVRTPPQGDLAGLWRTKQNGTILYRSPQRSKGIIEFKAKSLTRTQTLRLVLNDQQIARFKIGRKEFEQVEKKVVLSKGTNNIRFELKLNDRQLNDQQGPGHPTFELKEIEILSPPRERN